VLITWDPEKAAANLDKHGVDFQDAATVFTDPLSDIIRIISARGAIRQERRFYEKNQPS
jgi:uncharacterized DUF497 family protein